MSRIRTAVLRLARPTTAVVEGLLVGSILLLGLLAIGIVTSGGARSEPIRLDGATIESAFAPGDAPARLVAEAIGEATDDFLALASSWAIPAPEGSAPLPTDLITLRS